MKVVDFERSQNSGLLVKTSQLTFVADSSDQMYTGLVNGGMVYIVPMDKRGNPLEITNIMQQHAITYTKATPSEYSLWMQFGGDSLKRASAWRFAFGGGEPLTTTVTQEFADLELPQLRVFNSYGPTEISISSTKMEIPYREKETLESMGRIPCGFSLPNYFTYTIDDQMRPLPPGMPGELCIGGAGVSQGYLNNKELTDQHFVPNPFATQEDIANGWTRMYRTSDIGHLSEAGAMFFHNRIAGNTQVKIRGLRIELSDIESNMISAAGGALREAVVTLRKGDPEFLVAHVVFAAQHTITNKDVFLEQLLSHLPVPQYMVPVIAIALDELPLTNHSKVDRKAVKEMPLPRMAESTQEDAELSETMVQLRALWEDILGSIKDLGLVITPSSNFFLVGGNSLLVIRLQSRIREAFNVAVPLIDLLGANTLSQMARKIEETAKVSPINWEDETAPPAIPSFLADVSTARLMADGQKAKTVLVTGATGFLSKYLLPQLVARPDVETIHCIAVRDPSKLYSSEKIVCHPGDLSVPLLGLSEGEFHTLSGKADVILHMGAARSFWDNYNILRPSNFHSTQELIKLAAPRRIPIHYTSSGGVLGGRARDALSAANRLPPTDGTDGYTATRWASERILERSAGDIGVPSFVYRFFPAATQECAPQEVLDEFVRCVDVTGAVPDATGWAGRLDMVPAEQLARWLVEATLDDNNINNNNYNNNKPSTASTQFTHYPGRVTVTDAELTAYIQQQRGGGQFEHVPLLKWIGQIKKAGFRFFLASHEATVVKGGDGDGDGLGSGNKLELRR